MSVNLLDFNFCVLQRDRSFLFSATFDISNIVVLVYIRQYFSWSYQLSKNYCTKLTSWDQNDVPFNILSYIFYPIKTEVYLIIILSFFYVWSTLFRITTQTNKQEVLSRSNTRNFTANYRWTPWPLYAYLCKDQHIYSKQYLLGTHTAFHADLYFVICILLKVTITFKIYWSWPYKIVNTFNAYCLVSWSKTAMELFRNW